MVSLDSTRGSGGAAVPLLEVEGLRVAFRSGDALVEAIADASLSVPAGGAVGLVGESGSGKSTFVRTMMGLHTSMPAEMSARRMAVDGVAISPSDTAAISSLRGRTFAMVFQDPLSYLNPLMRVGRQIREAVRLHDRGADEGPRIRELLELTQLQPRVERAYPHELSGGMRQRVLMAIALACRPRLLLADEPTTALDATTQKEVLLLLKSIRQELGMAILLISHDLSTIASLCNEVAVMYRGRTIERGTREQIFGNPQQPYTQSLLAAAQAKRDASGRFVTYLAANE